MYIPKFDESGEAIYAVCDDTVLLEIEGTAMY